jgi:hypothetical protein
LLGTLQSVHTLPSSIKPSQSLSNPSQISAVGVQAMATSNLLQLHFDPVPGSVPSSLRHTPPMLFSQLVQLPTSMIPSPSVSVQKIEVENVKVVNRQVPPPPPVQGPMDAFPHGFVFCAYTSPHTSVG